MSCRPELVQDAPRGVDLAQTAVDHDEVGQAPAQLLGDPLLRLERAVEAAAQHLAVAGVVVGRPEPRPWSTRKRRYSPLRGRPSSNTTMLPTVFVPWMVLMS